MDDFYKKLGERMKKMRKEIELSQEDFAKRLGIKRVSVSQIENGERRVTAEEIFKIARTFNISIDNLLDVERDIKVILERKPEQQKNREIRICVPQKNIDKFKEVLVYILNKVGAKPNLGETVLYKLLYFIDFDFYEKYEEQLMGITYIKNHYGPTPVEFKKIMDEMEEKDIRKIKDKYFKYPRTKYLPLREPDLNKLKANETKVIDEVLERLSDMNAKQISEYSHNDVPWLVCEDGEIINYESVFYRTLPYSVRHYSEKEEDI